MSIFPPSNADLKAKSSVLLISKPKDQRLYGMGQALSQYLMGHLKIPEINFVPKNMIEFVFQLIVIYRIPGHYKKGSKL